FFVVSRGDQDFYTRAGNFQLDAEGRLVSGTSGFRLQGRMATNGVLSQTVGDIRIPAGLQAPAKATTLATIGGNLDANAELGAAGAIETTVTVYDSQGGKHELKVTLTRTDDNTWTWTADPAALGLPANAITDNDGDAIIGGGTLVVDAETGLPTSPATNPTLSFTPDGGTSQMNVEIDFGAGTLTGLTQFAGNSSAGFQEQDGYMAGTLESFSVDRTGTITGGFSNGNSLVIGQIALASF